MSRGFFSATIVTLPPPVMLNAKDSALRLREYEVVTCPPPEIVKVERPPLRVVRTAPPPPVIVREPLKAGGGPPAACEGLGINRMGIYHHPASYHVCCVPGVGVVTRRREKKEMARSAPPEAVPVPVDVGAALLVPDETGLDMM